MIPDTSLQVHLSPGSRYLQAHVDVESPQQFPYLRPDGLGAGAPDAARASFRRLLLPALGAWLIGPKTEKMSPP